MLSSVEHEKCFITLGPDLDVGTALEKKNLSNNSNDHFHIIMDLCQTVQVSLQS